MKAKLLRLSQFLIVFLLLVVFLLGTTGEQGFAIAGPSTASTTTAEVQDGNISSLSDATGGKTWQAATKPWTVERMQAAKPADVIGLVGEPAFTIGTIAEEVQSGFSPSALPEDTLPTPALLSDVDLDAFASPLGYSYPSPFTRYRHFQSYTTFPYMTTGVLFFSLYGGDYRCSAASIGNYAIWTAGHCVHAGDGLFSGWAYDAVFIPAYKDGASPLGIWTASNLWTRTEWYDAGNLYNNGGDLRFDLGGAILNVNGSGQKISQVVGNLGFSYGISKVQHWTDLGYPAASPFNGKYLEICQSSQAYDDTSLGTPYPVGIGCDLTGGSSGGPWILNFSGYSGTTNYLNGQNSYRYTNHQLEMFSPYFGDEAKSLWDSIIADTP